MSPSSQKQAEGIDKEMVVGSPGASQESVSGSGKLQQGPQVLETVHRE